MTPAPIRASELGTYRYCRRAWWLARQGALPQQGRRREGAAWHKSHVRKVMRARLLRFLGYVCLLAALAGAAALFALYALG